MYNFSVDCNTFGITDTIHIHQCLMEKLQYKIKCGLIRKNILSSSFTGSLGSVVKVPDCAKCVSLNDQPYITWPALVDIYADEYKQGLHY